MGPALAVLALAAPHVRAGPVSCRPLLLGRLLGRLSLLRLDDLPVPGVGPLEVVVHRVVVAAVAPGRGIGPTDGGLDGDEIRRLAALAVEVAWPARAVPIPRGPDPALGEDLAAELGTLILARMLHPPAPAGREQLPGSAS